MKKTSKKQIVCISVALSILLTLLSAFFFAHFIHEKELDQIQKKAISELVLYEGRYDVQTLVLSNTNPSSAELLAEKTGAQLRINEKGNFATLSLPQGITVKDIYEDDEYREVLNNISLDFYATLSDVNEDVAEPHLPSVPDYNVADSLYSNQSYLNYLNMADVWNRYKGDGIKVAVIDTGIDTDHPEFAGKISDYSYNATEDRIVKDYADDWSLIEDIHGHGTSVAGIIASAMDENGIVGIAPNVTLIVIKCECSADGNYLRSSDLVFGLYYAIECGADVVNMSFGTQSNEFEAALRLAVDNDVICVAAAGNESSSSLTYPAADPNCIGVGSLSNNSWELSAYSNFGENSDVVAPGTVFTTAVGGGYHTEEGTSFSSPIVAASVALLRQQNKNMEYDDVLELLYASSFDLGGLGEDFYYGFGAVDVSALILEERGKVTFDMLTNEVDDLEYVFIRNHTLQNIPEPERLYSVFDGWYFDIHIQDELNWYTDVFTTDITLYAGWGYEDDSVPYTYVTLDDGTIEIRSYTGHRRFITIPDKIDGKIVSSIGDYAFSGQTKLRQINLPQGLTKIGNSSFADCICLTSIEIPKKVKTIGTKAFANDARLYEIVFAPDGKLEKIGTKAFSNCSLFMVDIPKSVTELSGEAFTGCTSLIGITVEKGSKTFVSNDGVLYNQSGSTLIAYPAGKKTDLFVVSDSTSAIGSFAFAYSKIDSIELNNVTFVGAYAFSFSTLSSAEIPDSVVNVEAGAFYHCNNLDSVILSNNMTSIKGGTFGSCSELRSITIPKNVKTILYDSNCGGAFENCFSLESVIFENDSELILIDSKVFYNNNLKSIEIPSRVVTIASQAFAMNTNLSNVLFADKSVLQRIGGGTNSENSGTGAFYGCMSLSSIQFPDSLTSIAAFAFEGSGLSEIGIPKNVSSIGCGAFASCQSLKNICVDDSNVNYIDKEGVLYSSDCREILEYPAGRAESSYTIENTVVKIGDCAFYGSLNLTTVVLPSGLETVGEYGFYDCEKITSYSLPSSLTNIERYAFAKNSSIISVNIPDNVIQISNYAFAYDDKCRSINFGSQSKLPRISFAAFAYTGITSFRVPANVSSIAQYAFSNCSRLYSVTFSSNSRLESISAYVFDGADNLQNIIFENGSALKSIQAHGFEGLSTLRTIDFGDAKLESIGNYAFRYDRTLSSITLPETLTEIGRYAFYGANNLIELYIPASVDSIGRFAFYGAKSLNLYFLGISLPINLQENWDYSISGYYVDIGEIVEAGDWKYAQLKDGNIAIIKYRGTNKIIDFAGLNFGGSVTQIGGYAFANSEVTSVSLPGTLRMIQRYAFVNSKIESIFIPESVSFIGQYAFAYTPIATATIGSSSVLFKIEQYAFAYTKQLTSFAVPQSVTVMESYAFYESGISCISFASDCKITKIYPCTFSGSSLASIAIPDSVNYIDDNAFRDCANLSYVTFGKAENLQIHANAFYNSALSSLYIPANVEYIGEYAFIGLKNLSAYSVDDGNQWYKSVDGVLYSKDGRKLIAFPANRGGSFEIPNYVETIGFGAFENNTLNYITFAKNTNILTIGYRAFFNSQNLTSLTIPESVISLDYYAFAMCSKLESVSFSDGNHLSFISEGVFYNDKSLKNITVPDSIEEISDYAFYGCRALNSIPVSDSTSLKILASYSFAYSGINGTIVLPDAVSDIGDYCFCGTDIKEFVIDGPNENNVDIGIGVLQNCKKLETLNIPFTGSSYYENKNVWFGFIFGAGSVKATKTYVPTSLKTVIIDKFTGYSNSLSWYDTFGTYSIGSELFPEAEIFYIPEGITVIPGEAFMDMKKLVNVTIPGSVTSIGTRAFKECESLQSVYMEDSVMSIGYEAFCDCSDLADIRVSRIVTKIGDGAFRRCSSLKKMTLPEGLESIGICAFSECSNLESINIPEGIDKIRSSTFYACKNLQGISLPTSLSEIDDAAFCYCENLKSIDIPSGVTRIGNSAFSGCSGINTISLPEGLLDIDMYAFSNTGITSVRIPSTVTEVNGFSNCIHLNEVILHNGITGIGERAFIGCSELKEISITGNVQNIGSYAFAGTGLSEITLPDSVISIGNNAFSDSALISISLPEGVQNLGAGAFSGCQNLAEVHLPQSVLRIPSSTFAYCNKLRKVYIPSSLESIMDGAFTNCTSLFLIENHSSLNITLGSNEYGQIGRYAQVIIDKNGNKSYIENGQTFVDTAEGFVFEKRTDTYILVAYLGNSVSISLPADIEGHTYSIYRLFGNFKSVSLPGWYSEIDTQAFANCSQLESVVLSENTAIIGNEAFSNCCNLSSITIPSSTILIKANAFYNCTGLTEITIPDNSLVIENGAFNCSGLEKINIEGTNYHFSDGVLYNSDYSNLIYVGKNVENLVVPEQMTYIPNGFVRNNTSLKSIELHDKITGIGNVAFSGCTGLTNMVIPDSVNSIQTGLFSGCTSLVSVTLPNNLLYIRDYAFENCTSLESIVIPESVISIGNHAFSYCNKLKNINLPEELNTIESYTFYNCSSLQSIVMPPKVTEIKIYAFYNCESLKTVEFPKTLRSIGYQAFNNCFSLESIVLPDSVESVGDACFRRCLSLKNVLLSENMTSLNRYVFADCENLANINIPDSINSFGYGAFDYCTSLTSIRIPEEITELYLSGCTSLRIIDLPEGLLTLSLINCSSLSELIVPESVVSLNLTECSGLTSVNVPDGVKNLNLSYCSGIKAISIPEGVTSIAFERCSSLEEVVIPDGVLKLSASAFSGCQKLKMVKLSNTITEIENLAFLGCTSLTKIVIPECVKSIGNMAFGNCSSLFFIELPESLTSIGMNAFSNCSALKFIKNKSKLSIIPGYTDNGMIGQNAEVIIDSSGNLISHDINSSYVVSSDGFLFQSQNSQNYLRAYLGEENTVLLPDSYLEGNYTISYMRGVINVIIPDSFTEINNEAFSGCTSLESVSLPVGLTRIGRGAFLGCTSLKNIVLPESVSEIGVMAFNNCTQFNGIVTLGQINYCGRYAFDDTEFVKDKSNYVSGALIAGNYLIKVDSDCQILKLSPTLNGITDDAFENAYSLRYLEVDLSFRPELIACSNLQTLVVYNEIPDRINVYNKTLQNVVLKSDIKLSDLSYTFRDLKDVTIFVEDIELTIQWNHDYSNWNNGNAVYYGGEWITCEFYDSEGKWIETSFQSVSRIIHQPYVADVIDGKNKYVFIGWDINGDGLEDGMPATSAKNIVAQAVMKETDNICRVTFYDYFKNVIISTDYIWGDIIILPQNPEKIGYSFNGWISYSDGMSATENANFYGIWIHDGDGHSYGTETFPSFCDEPGYDKHICTICGDEYRDNFTKALGHIFGEWIIESSATCTDIGQKHRICAVCSEREDEDISAIGHNFSILSEISANCTCEGEIAYKCSRCTDEFHEVTAMTEHQYVKKLANKTWSSWLIDRLLNMFYGFDGNEVVYYACSECGHVMTYDEGISIMTATAQQTCTHSLGEWQVTLSPSCSMGVSEKICTECGCTVEAKTLPAISEHVFSDWTITVPATVTNEGVKTRICIHCAETDTEVIEKLQFVYGDANGDGLINGQDVIRLKKYLANYNYNTGTSTVEILPGADANGDGNVNGQDVIRLKKYLANYNYNTGTSTIVLGPTL